MERSKLTFLSLPRGVRERIYIMAGLVRCCAINLQEEAERWSKIRAAYIRQCGAPKNYFLEYFGFKSIILQWHTPGSLRNKEHPSRCVFNMKLDFPDHGKPGQCCIHDPLPLALLQISRRIREETIVLFYSRNTFIINTEWLRRKTTPWLKFDLLKSVEVQLTTCSCIIGHKCLPLVGAVYEEYIPCDLCHYGCKRGVGEPLAIGGLESKAILENWAMLCESLQEKCGAGLRQLALIADCKDLATALTVVQPLEKGFPVLEHASIRLGQSCNGKLGNLAKQIVQKLTGANSPQSTTLTPPKLPHEVLEMILQYTDLVANDYLSWFEPPLSENQDAHKYRQKRTFHGLWPFGNKHYVCCVQCTPSREVCACPSRHAAYSSHTCKCWQFPKSLFLVSKAFHAMAVKVFCSKNRFILFEWAPDQDIDENAQARHSSNVCERLAMPLEFIQSMPPIWSQYIQWLKFRGTQYRWNEGLPDSDPDCYSSWKALTRCLKQWLRVDKLTIEFDVSSDYRDWEIGLVIPEDEENTAFESLWNIIKLFKLPHAHQTYKDFFIRFDYYVPTWQDEDTRWHLEKKMEKYLMGEDYDAAARGKYHDKRQYNESLRPKRCWANHDITMQLTEEDLYEP